MNQSQQLHVAVETLERIYHNPGTIETRERAHEALVSILGEAEFDRRMRDSFLGGV